MPVVEAGHLVYLQGMGGWVSGNPCIFVLEGVGICGSCLFIRMEMSTCKKGLRK